MHRFSHLHGQFASRHQDDRHRPGAVFLPGGKFVQERQGESRRLARAGRRLAHKVLALEQRRDRLPLNRCRLLITELDDRLEQTVIQPQR